MRFRSGLIALAVTGVVSCDSNEPDNPYKLVVDANGMVRYRADPNFRESYRYVIKGKPVEDGCSWSGADTVTGVDTLPPGEIFGETMVAMNPTTCEGIMARGHFIEDPDSAETSHK
jgi:hypothetical protein